MHYFIILFCETLRSLCTSLSCHVDNTGVCNSIWAHGVNNTDLRVTLILSSLHILSCLMEDKPYLVDTYLVVALSWCWLLGILDISQRPLYTSTPSVLWIMTYWIYCHSDHTLGLLCLCLSSWFLGEFSHRKILTNRNNSSIPSPYYNHCS